MPKVPTPKLAAYPAIDFDPAPILALVERLSWRTARKLNRWGKPQVPHSYTVRNSRMVAEKGAAPDPQAEADYIQLFEAIEQHGRIEKYNRDRRFYLYPGDGRKYWAMSSIETSGVINMMLIEDDLDRMRATGQLVE